MSSSNLNKLRNEILALERDSDKFVSSKKYYAIEITIPDIDEDKIKQLGKDMVLDADNQPLFSYICHNRLYLFFSCLEQGSHYLNGSHHLLCSTYGSKITETCQNTGVVTCKLIELDTQNQVYIYLVWKNTEAHFESLSRLLDCTLEEAYKNTLQESTELLEKKGIIWDDVSKFGKFGIIYRLKEKRGKVVVSTFSTFLDSRKKTKHMDYLFG